MRNPPKLQPPQAPPPPTHTLSGRRLQKNQGKWPFSLKTFPTIIVLRVSLSKHIDTSLISVDVLNDHICVDVKGKQLILVLEPGARTNSGDVLCERSKTSGELCVTMVRIDAPDNVTAEVEIPKEGCLKLKQSDEMKKPKIMRRDMILKKSIGIIEVKKEFADEEPFVDDPEVPPLC
ncbi:hypothetical protein HK096_000331 [Nowakowskiella sp. JEL0078]|nr:hypothetical protein HK096_000331 [Nowakowskiella sp. JEL0078]